MCNSITYPILRHLLGYTHDQQFQHYCHLVTLGIQMCLLVSWHEYVQQCCEVYACLTHNGLQADYSSHKWYLALVSSRITSSCILKCKHTTLAINMLHLHIFHLHTKPQTIISRFPVWYVTWHNVNILSNSRCTCVDKYYHIGNQWSWHLETYMHLV